MAPQTRSMAKASPGRSTRNSVHGRPPLPPSSARKNPTDKFTVHAQAQDRECDASSNLSSTKGTPWLACRDAYGVMTSVAMSETGEGIHIRWYYPEDDIEVSEDEDADVGMGVDEEREVTPVMAGPNLAVRRPFPQTPIAPHPYNAGSVLRTPVKKARPLQPSPPRIGDKGIRCLYERGGILRELNGGARIVLRHPVGSTVNLSRAQVELLEKEREEEIVRVQVEKLLAQKQRIEEEGFYDSSGEDGMDTDMASTFQQSLLPRDGTNGTIVIPEDLPDAVPPVSENAPNFFRGPNGELVDRHGRQMLGREGTILIDTRYAFPRREEACMESTEIVANGYGDGLHRPRLGPEGTELIDS